MAKKLRRSWSPSGRPLVALFFFSWISVSDVAAATNGSLAINSPSFQQHKNDLCLTGSCQNNATCLGSAENPGVFTCLCPTGWTGRVCDVDIDECSDSLNRCQNGALCRNFPGGFQCYCVPGYLGEFCDMEANECLAQPCRNGATCLDKLNGYECSCTIGASGSFSEFLVAKNDVKRSRISMKTF
jgi:Calcium-binding EGF domain/EGF-like domain/Human growth factor-like EGF